MDSRTCHGLFAGGLACVLFVDRGAGQGEPKGAETRPAAGVKAAFDDLADGAAPKGWSFSRLGDGPEAKWTVERDGANGVLKQSSADPADFRFLAAVVDGFEAADVSLTVRFKPLSGEVDQAGGLVFRYRDEKNYLLCRANVLEANFRVYAVVDGKRKQLKSQNTRVTANEWHTLRVECRGTEIRCTFNRNEPLAVEVDETGAGKVGVWTKSDSVTLFDDLEAAPIAKG